MRFLHWLLFIPASTCLILGGALWADEISYKVPKEFEVLLEEQSALVDVYYKDSYVGEAMITYTMTHVTLENPGLFVKLFDDLIHANDLHVYLLDPIPSHASRVCSSRNETNCGTLSPKNIGVIFDEANFRLDVFINPNYRTLTSLNRKKYLPITHDKLSSVHGLNYTLSGSEKERRYSFFANSTAGWKRHRLQSSLVKSHQDNTSIDYLHYDYELNDLEWQLGAMPMSFQIPTLLPSSDILGTRIFSHSKRRNDQDLTTASPVVVFLERDSRVELYTRGRLISARMYAAGNQEIDTRSLPSGSYPIDLRIIDGRGVVKEERVFFTKNSSLPSIGDYAWLFEIGKQKNRIEPVKSALDKKMFLRGGLMKTIMPGFALSFQGAATEEERYIDSYIQGLFENGQFRLGVGMTDHGAWTYDMQFSYEILEMTLNTNRRVTSENIALFYSADDLGRQQPEQQNIVNLSVPMDAGYLSFNYRHQKVGNQTHMARGLQYRYSAGWLDRLQSALIVDASKNNEEWFFNLGFEMTFSGPTLSSRLSSVYTRENAEGILQSSPSTQVSINNRWIRERNIKLDTNVDYFQNQRTSQSRLSSTIDTSFLTFDGIYQYSDNNEKESFETYGANLSASVATMGTNVALGNDARLNTGVIVSLESEIKKNDALFQVNVDGAPVRYVKPGTAVFVPLNAYESYRVSISQKSGEWVDFDTRESTVTLYPGLIDRVVFGIDSYSLVVGRLILHGGRILSNTLVRSGNETAMTDDNGWFQIKMNKNEKVEVIKEGRIYCDISLINSENVLIDESIICVPEDLAINQ